MSDGEGSDYDVPDLPPMLPEMDDLPPVRGLSSPSANAASHQTSNGTDGHDDAGNSTQNGDAAAPPAEKPKKIRKPVPKLDAIRLCDSKRGLPHLVKDFKSIRYKGKGHEASDIKMLMRRYEHWAHRLFPKYPLHTVTEIVETSLASKRDVRVCLVQLRRGDDEDGNGDSANVDILAPEPVVPLQAMTM